MLRNWFLHPARLTAPAMLVALVFAVVLSASAYATTVEPEAVRADGLAELPSLGASPFAQPLSDRIHIGNLRVIATLRGGLGDTEGLVGVQMIAGTQDRLATRLWNRGHSMPGWHAFRSVPAVAMFTLFGLALA